ncbi:MAG: cupin domain-containing protein [Aggregatilineales bacterium]
MIVIDHKNQPIEWHGRDNNIEHRLILDHTNGATALTLWEIFPPEGAGAPPHVHHNCEEVITVLSGRIKAQLDHEIFEAAAGQTLFIPAGVGHSFGVISDEKAHLLIAFSSADVQWERVGWNMWLNKK